MPRWLLLAAVQLALSTAPLAADEPTLRLRIAWGGGAERIWRGTIRVDRGSLADPRPLGLEPDEPGSMWLDETGAVVIKGASPRAYDGVDVEVRADLAARLVLAFSPDDTPPSEPISVELKQLVGDFHNVVLDDQNNRLLVRRVPGDKLRVEVVSPSLVFAPGDRLMLRVTPHLLEPDFAGDVLLRWHVVTARGKHEHATGQQQLKLPADGQSVVMPLELKVPAQAGVYDLALTAERPSSDRLLPIAAPRELLPKFVKRSDALAERKVQFVVLDTRPADAPQPAPPNAELMVINPAKTWWERVAQLPRIPGLGKDPLEHGKVERWEHPRLGPMVRLSGQANPKGGPAGATRSADGGEAWVAYPLGVNQPGQVHVVEVEYPSDIPQAMGLSIVEPNAAGVVIPVGLDSGVHVPAEAAGAPARVATHRLVFWPRTREPLLLISKVGTANAAIHGRVRLLGPRNFGVGALRLGSDTHTGLPPAAAARATEERLVAASLDRPLFPENFGATQALDSWSGQSLDDWITFHDGAQRLIEYARHAGYNALVVAVLADGSSIYPSRHLGPTPRYDTGQLFSTGQDPVRKDVLELLLRLADREGIPVFPQLHFSAPLPALEQRLRRGERESAGLELIGPTGVTWTERHGTAQGLSASYNPLDPRVQEAMRQVIRELIERYGHHRSFAGVALGSSSLGYTLLPGPDWGLDDATIGRYTEDTGRAVPGAGPGRFATRARFFADAEQRAAWLRWRADRLHRFHAAVRDDLVAARPEARLLINLSGALESPDIEALLRPALPGRFKLEELPLAVGIRPELYRDDREIVLLRPRLVAAPPSLHAVAIERQANHSPELDRALSAAGVAANQFVHPAQKLRLASFDRLSPFGADKTYLVLAPQLAPGGSASRRHLAETLATGDAPLVLDGGPMLTLGAESALAPALVAYRRLPVGPYQPVAGEGQGVVARTLARDGATYLCVVNPTPWPCRASLTAQGADSVEIVELDGRERVAPPRAGRLSFQLEPYDVLAVRFAASDVQLSELQATFDDSVRAGLEQRIRDLVTRAAALGAPSEIRVLHNSDFELRARKGEVPGWFLAGAEGAEAVLDSGEKQSGGFAVRLSSRGGVASLISNSFAPPRTGRISFRVWLRAGDDAQPPPTLRLAIGGRLGTTDYYRYGTARIGPQWGENTFQLDNLPLSGLSELQVRFDLMGTGRVWIDKIVVSDLTFSANERTELSRIITRAHFSLEDGKLAECARMLDGYWPRFLEENVPLPKTTVAANPARPAEEPAPPAAEPPAESKPWWRPRLPSVFK